MPHTLCGPTVTSVTDLRALPSLLAAVDMMASRLQLVMLQV